MRLDHLLSREEVGVVLLLICEGRSRCLRKHVEEERQRERSRAQAMMLSIAGGDIEERNLVAMRLWETPVLIPNTKVKT